jgi:hypothetical protein
MKSNYKNTYFKVSQTPSHEDLFNCLQTDKFIKPLYSVLMREIVV